MPYQEFCVRSSKRNKSNIWESSRLVIWLVLGDRMIRFRQALMEFNVFCGWHYWGFINNHFISPAENDNHKVKSALKNSQQCVGAVDINGHYFYEGDIIKIHNHFLKLGIIEYSPPHFYIYDGNDGAYTDFTWEEWEKDFEIIGNVYENKDLITKVKNQ